MIDLHSHILPGVDDGPADWDSALAMMAMAADAGTEILVATPHSHQIWRPAIPPRELVPRLVEEANQRAGRAGLSLRVLAGQECLIHDSLPAQLKEGQWLTLGGSKTVLLELSFTAWPSSLERVVTALQQAGYRVLLAHPERYQKVQKSPNVLYPLVNQGMLMQITTGSLVGTFGERAKDCARLLLTHKQVHVVASDAHTTRNRHPRLNEARDEIAGWLGEEVAEQLLVETPKAILQDRPIARQTPRPIKSTGRWPGPFK